MVNKDTTSNDVLIKVDHNNLIYIDPNSVVKDGFIQGRQIEPENFVMYVNLEADLIPRTTLIADGNKTTLTSIASGTLSFLRNKNGTDLDTSWTDVYTEQTRKDEQGNDVANMLFTKQDTSGQSFGIDSINIRILGANFVPRIDIKFIDVRGKTVFESPENSPYKAFFHLPWPIFYLTVKGYYGKAIRYRLHMISFSSRYNDVNGNFEVNTKFVGSTYAYLNDIPLDAILNAPYLYGIKATESTVTNENTGEITQTLKKTSRGYVTLKAVYQEYVQKGLLPPVFSTNIKTLREVIVIAKKLDKILEEQIFSQVIDPQLLAGIKDFDDLITNFEGQLNSWKLRNLSPEYFTTTSDEDGVKYYILNNNGKVVTTRITGTDSGTLYNVLKTNIEKSKTNLTFGNILNKTAQVKELKIHPITFNSLEPDKYIKQFYFVSAKEGKIGVDFDEIYERFNTYKLDFYTQKKSIADAIQTKMNEIVKDPQKGMGFEPTIRNLVGIILANADAYIRLLKQVHQQAFNSSNKRNTFFSQTNNGLTTDSIDANIYPWPEIKKPVAGRKQNVLVYPGSFELAELLQSYNSELWPEVGFVEEFIKVATKKVDTLSEKEDQNEIVTYEFEQDSEVLEKVDISTLTYQTKVVPYYNKSVSSFLYEIWERIKYVTSFDTFNNETIRELADNEYQNILSQISEDVNLIKVLKQQVTSIDNLKNLLLGVSPYERYPYYIDQIPTTPYLQSTIDENFTLEKYTSNTNVVGQSQKTKPLEQLPINLDNYIVDPYRQYIFPFSSDEYSNYLSQSLRGTNRLKLNKILSTNNSDGFITSPVDGTLWIKTGYDENLFTNKISFGDDEYKHILNTPYFHKHLYNDFVSNKTVSKYASSAYLLLNSLPYKDLSDEINGTSIVTMFKEVGATHFIPYYLMLKFGAIYHRYKRYLIDGVDIIDDITDPIDGDLFFDNYLDRTYTVTTGGATVNKTNETNIGINPFYQSIYHQIVNGYTFCDVTTDGNTNYYSAVESGIIKNVPNTLTGKKSWISFIDNSKFDDTDQRYTFLPSNGAFMYNDLSDYDLSEQENYNVLWDESNKIDVLTYTGETFPPYNQYFTNTGNTYTLSDNNKRVIDLIGVFKSEILETFEYAFLDFASESLTQEINFKPYDVTYPTFQSLLKDIVSVDKKTTDITNYTITDIIKDIKARQTIKLKDITSKITSNNNLLELTLSNPKEIDNYILGGFTNINGNSFTAGNFDLSQLTQTNLDFIKLYVGEDVDSILYSDFFSVNNIQLNEDNIKSFRFLIHIYAGYRKNGGTNTKTAFVDYLKTNIINPQDERIKRFFETLIPKFGTLNIPSESNVATIDFGYGDEILKLELYNFFKSFNDKWISGNSIGQTTLMEEFLFLDKANRDIGDQVFLDMRKLIDIAEQKDHHKVNLFSIINLLIKDSGFDIRPLPAYVNFYSTNFNNKNRVVASKKLGKNLFGTFLEVDYQESSPKIILQYVGPTSKYLDMREISKDYKYKNDSFDISNTNNNPIIIEPESFRYYDFLKSNKAVAFEVSFGDQNQSIFKGLNLDQSSIKNTSESFDVLERLGSQETGSSTAQIDIGLFDIYRQASYTCEVTAMGNVMIQPTMYFYLKNVPLFKGTYWIFEVNHDIKRTGIETRFKGTRIPLQSLPDPKDSFIASYRTLFDNLTTAAALKIKQESLDGASGNNSTRTTDSQTTTEITLTDVPIAGEKLIEGAGIMPYAIPYNGHSDIPYITKISYYDTGEWLKTKVVQLDGRNYQISDDMLMSLLTQYNLNGNSTGIKWSDVKTNKYIYSSIFNIKAFEQINSNFILDGYLKTEFYNPAKRTNNLTIVSTTHDFANNIYGGPVHLGPSGGEYGLGLSEQLMKDLDVYDGDYIYFRLKTT